jgi:hypothetical protein
VGEYFQHDPSSVERLSAEYLEARVTECREAVFAFFVDNDHPGEVLCEADIKRLRHLVELCNETVGFAESLIPLP